MAGVKGNRRVLYTKKIIKESLLHLLQTKKIHQITVTDICKKANINRGTFYTHYSDAYDLLKTMEDELFDEILKYIEETSIEEYKNVLLLKVLELIYDNKDLSKILLCQNLDNDIMDRIIYLANKAEIDKLISSPKIDDVFLDYFIKYSVGGVLAIIKGWLESDLNESPKYIMELINDINSIKN